MRVNKKLKAKVFFEAANKIEAGMEQFACNAVKRVLKADYALEMLHLNLLHELFKPSRLSKGTPYFSMLKSGGMDWESGEDTRIGKLRRQIALDLLGIIAQDEVKKSKRRK